uniref:Exocyst complex component SEC6 n=1 Tax=Tanacetum cinerariifolium TaxID=118510 RepID=A0A6L2MHG1_TANCI|nr:exocyst complex component SEC6 [Tanacetum cinerariifolium]
MSIPVEAIAAYDFLSDDKDLIDTYETLTTLNGKRMFPLAAVRSHKKEVGRLSFYSFRDQPNTPSLLIFWIQRRCVDIWLVDLQ